MLQINDPCPVSKTQFEKIGENCYFCKGCNEKVIDFTTASDSEILAYKGQNICGIFREDQLAAQPVFRWKKKMLFHFLTAASFFGFTVSPVHADELIPSTNNQVEISADKEHKKLFKPKKKKRRKKAPKKVLSRPNYL